MYHNLLKWTKQTSSNENIQISLSFANLDLPLQALSRRYIRCISHICIDLGYSLMLNVTLHKISITFKPDLKSTSAKQITVNKGQTHFPH